MAGRNESPQRNGANNGYQMADRVYGGEIVEEFSGTKWHLGELIGDNLIYAATLGNTHLTSKPRYGVVKFTSDKNEQIFFFDNTYTEDVEPWRKKKNLSHLGVPQFLGSGSHEDHGKFYDFLVMERYGTDLQTLFLENGRRFPEHTVYKIALQIIDVLEYIHHRGFIHGDICGEHLLLDMKTQNFIYLIDYRLALPYTTRQDYNIVPENAHRGTIEYMGRDAHMGVPTMRSDLENLVYNMIQWLSDSLPWIPYKKEPGRVKRMKDNAYRGPPNSFLTTCFGPKIPSTIEDYMDTLGNLEFDEKPNYEDYREILTDGLQELGYTSSDRKLEFSRVD